MQIILLALFLSLTANARELEVWEKLRYFHLDFSAQSISLQTQGMDSTLVRSECNSHILNKFMKRLDRSLKRETLWLGHKPQELNLRLDGKEYHARADSKLALMLAKVPMEVQRMRDESHFLCSKK